jgi:hypothetical protein
LANVLITYIFNPHSVIFFIEEFVVACVLSIPITELNRIIDRKLEAKISWTEFPKSRFTTHLVLISLSLIVSLNTIGTAYMWITQKGFFSVQELIIINAVTLLLAILLTMVKWSSYFYLHWIKAEARVTVSQQIANTLKQQLLSTNSFIEVQKGATKSRFEISDIRIIKIEFGTVRVHSIMGEKAVFSGTLSELNDVLPNHLFFQVTRDSIIHRDAIKSTTSSSYGKIQLTVSDGDDQFIFTVSRLKAATFRKWYYSSST